MCLKFFDRLFCRFLLRFLSRFFAGSFSASVQVPFSGSFSDNVFGCDESGVGKRKQVAAQYHITSHRRELGVDY